MSSSPATHEDEYMADPDIGDGYETDRSAWSGGTFTHAEFNAAVNAILDGRASELLACPVDGSRQGVARRGTTPGTHRDFNAGTWIELRCGHTIV